MSRHSEGLAQREISKALDRSHSEIYRMLSTLVRRGYVVRSFEDDMYSLSLKMFALSQRHPPVQRLRGAASPKMRAVARRVWQSCHMAMENIGDIVVMASASSPGNWSLARRSGAVLGLGNTSAERVFAAFRSAPEFDALIEEQRRVVGEPALDEAAFRGHVARVKSWGFERMASETTAGVTNLAYPILDTEHRAICVLVCPFLKRIDALDVPPLDEVHRAVQEIAQDLINFYCGHRAAAELVQCAYLKRIDTQ